MTSILFYVSGHGYGHAVRTGEVIKALKRLRPDWHMIVRSQAPSHMLPADVELHYAEIDSGVVERKAGVVMDEAATLIRLKAFLERWDAIVADEARFVRDHDVAMIVADIPPIAGDIAAEVGVPCIAISNFTWDWIYEPYAASSLERLEQGYRNMTALLRLPFYQPSRLAGFRTIIDAPLIARKHGGGEASGKKRVLLGSRAEVSQEALQRAVRDSVEFELVTVEANSSFTDQFAACDMVIAKLGFSMLAECIAAKKPILYPPRVNFREELVLQEHVKDHLAALPIPLEDFYSGNWSCYLRALDETPAVASTIRTDGAEFCAQFLASYR